MKTFFTQALVLSAPWRVVNVDVSPAEGLVAFRIGNTAAVAVRRCG